MVIDILVLVVLLISAGIAFMRGFIREVLTIAGVGGGLAAAYYGAPMLKPHMRGWFGVEEGIEPERLFGILPYDVLADALSYGAIFIVVVTVLSFVSHSLAEWARRVGLGAVDRSMGFLFGLIRGILLLGLLYLPVHLFVEQNAKADWFESSRTHFYLEKVAIAMAKYLPEETREQAEAAMAEAEKMRDAREALEEIDLLKPNDDSADADEDVRVNPLGIKDGIKDRDNRSLDGYDDAFRDGMDALIDQTSQQPVEQNTNGRSYNE